MTKPSSIERLDDDHASSNSAKVPEVSKVSIDNNKKRKGGGLTGPKTKTETAKKPLQKSIPKSEQIRGQQKDQYYQRLCHGCRKDLWKHAKLVKTFECRKLIRKLKDCKNSEKTSSHVDSNGNNKSELTQDLELLKQSNIIMEAVVQECFHRLGLVLQVKNNYSERNKKEDNDDDDDASAKIDSDGSHDNQSKANKVRTLDETKVSSNDSQNSNDLNQVKQQQQQQQQRIRQWTDRIIKHKKLGERFEYWSGQIAIYHRWCSEHDGGNHAGVPSKTVTTKDNSKQKKRKRTDKQQEERDADHKNLASLDSTIFVKLGGTETDEVEAEEDGENEPDGDHDDLDDPFASSTKKTKKMKKNRPGQRDRRAAAIAAGRPASGNAKRRDPATTKDKEDTTERLHPSWEARKSQKAGIVAFAGKKITFGDDSNEATAGAKRSVPQETASSLNTSVWKQSKENTVRNPPSDKSAPQGHGHRRRDDEQVEKLHPSWQASKLKKEGIVAFAGKKITFDAS